MSFILICSLHKNIGHDFQPVLGGDEGEVDHLDRRPEKVVVQVDHWEPVKAD